MRLGWWVAAAAVFASWLLFHLPFTDLAELLLPRLGLANYDLLWNAAATAAGIAVVGFIANREDWALTPVTRATLALLAGIVAARALLLVAPIEYVHLPQYALLSVLLVKAGLPLEIAWLAATGLGALDEGFQFLFLRCLFGCFKSAARRWRIRKLESCVAGREITIHRDDGDFQ